MFSFRRSTFSDYVFSRATPVRSIYRRTGLLSVDSRRIVVIIAFAYHSLVPSGGELSSSKRSSAAVESTYRGVEGGGGVGIGSFERIEIGLSGKIPDPRKLKSILADVNASSRALIKAVVHSTRDIRPTSRRKRASIREPRARFSGLKRPTSRGYSRYDVCGGNTTKSIAFD